MEKRKHKSLAEHLYDINYQEEVKHRKEFVRFRINLLTTSAKILIAALIIGVVIILAIH
jgi:hypothetical protein